MLLTKKTTLAFVDMVYHKKTRSGDFLRNVLANDYDLVDYWYEDAMNDNEKCELLIKLSNHTDIIFFQVLLPYSDMLSLRRMNIKIIWAPMYDGLPMSEYYWKKSHAIAYSLAVVVQMNLICEEISYGYD
jgi:hypothetical protein